MKNFLLLLLSVIILSCSKNSNSSPDLFRIEYDNIIWVEDTVGESYVKFSKDYVVKIFDEFSCDINYEGEFNSTDSDGYNEVSALSIEEETETTLKFTQVDKSNPDGEKLYQFYFEITPDGKLYFRVYCDGVLAIDTTFSKVDDLNFTEPINCDENYILTC